MNSKHPSMCITLISIFILLSGCIGANNESEIEEPINQNDANLTLTLIPEELSSKDISNLQLILKNEGDYAVNVSKFEEHVTYNIIYSNGSDIGYESLPSIDAMGDSSLIELKPNESLSINVSSRSWDPFAKGNHSLSAKYFTGYNVFTKPHWNGALRSNNITLIVE